MLFLKRHQARCQADLIAMSCKFDDIFLKNTQEALGIQALDSFILAFDNEPAIVSVRRNPLKCSDEQARGHYEEIADGLVPWCTDGFYLKSRPLFQLDPYVHTGAFYVQDAASMVVQSIFKNLRPDSPARILDLCAAPGGKSSCIAACMGPKDLLVANEVIRSRATILAENLTKWGKSNVVITNNEADSFSCLQGYFDMVFADVPCSGEGMFRKDRDSIEQWTPSNVELCAARQRKIVASSWAALKEDGLLVYSTCTFNKYENDQNVAWICETLGADPLIISYGEDGNMPLRTKFGLQFLPGTTRSEGLYIAVLKKTANQKEVRLKFSKIAKSLYCAYVKDSYLAKITTSAGDLLKAYPLGLECEIIALEAQLRPIRSGVAIAMVKGKDLIPEPALALNELLQAEAFFVTKLSLEDALKYLRLEPLIIDAPKGFILAEYQGIPIGFLKNIGNRSNNLFPSAWRLRSTITNNY